jgi:hypothetical protein
MRARLGLLTLALTAALAAPAAAAPDKTASLDWDTLTFDWDGSGSGISKPYGLVGEPGSLGCGEFPAGNDCEDILLNVAQPGALTVKLTVDDVQSVPDPTGFFGDTALAFPDIDIYPWASDATGAKSGEEPLSTDGATFAGEETFTIKVAKPGYILLSVEFFNGIDATYTANATLAPSGSRPSLVQEVVTAVAPPAAPAAAPPAAAPPAPPAVPAAKKPSKRAACLKKAKKIRKAKARKKAVKRCKKLKR